MNPPVKVEIDISRWAFQASRYVTELAMDGKVVVKNQAGALARTLINLTPPKNLAQSKRALAHTVAARFTSTGSNSELEARSGDPRKQGHGDVRWIFSTPSVLMGVRGAQDLRQADDDELYKTYFTISKHRGAINAGSRGKQSVKLIGKLVVAKKQLTRLINRLQSHFGRQKAGWLPSFDKLQPKGAQPPQWVRKHGPGARGTFFDELEKPGAPSFTLINRALGIEKSAPIVKRALDVRVMAMMKDIDLYLKGVKQKAGFN